LITTSAWHLFLRLAFSTIPRKFIRSPKVAFHPARSESLSRLSHSDRYPVVLPFREPTSLPTWRKTRERVQFTAAQF
jgi:hypothetical protein